MSISLDNYMKLVISSSPLTRKMVCIMIYRGEGYIYFDVQRATSTLRLGSPYSSSNMLSLRLWLTSAAVLVLIALSNAVDSDLIQTGTGSIVFEEAWTIPSLLGQFL